MKKLITLVAAGGLALGLSACGGSNGPEQTVEDFATAAQDKDYEAFCDTIDPKLVADLEKASEGQKCAKVFEENEEELGDMSEGSDIEVLDSKIADDEKTATVTVKNEDGKEEDLELIKVEDDWKITFE